jgi:hypothetical protein
MELVMKPVLLVLLPLSLTFAGAAFAAAPSLSGMASPLAATRPMAARPNGVVSYRRDKPLAQRMTHALNILEANGYGDFANFRADGKNFAATVTDQGEPFSVVINPDSDEVSRS